jgi:lipoic acid synthetase
VNDKASGNLKIEQIPVVSSGSKYTTSHGFNAIKDGVKSRAQTADGNARKPDWLRAKVPGGGKFNEVRSSVRENRLATVCEESKCPNIGECWTAGTATIMVMGAVCTRACRFCSVDTGNPNGWLDEQEPHNTAQAVELMDLKYVVITSVDRDDLEDGGASHYAACVKAIKDLRPQTAVEALTPDFDGREALIEQVVDSGLEVFAQNVETVQRLTHPVNQSDAGAW